MTSGPRSEIGAAVPALCLGAMIVFAVGLLARSAAQLPFWYDESLTVRLSRLGSVAELWSAVTAGFEFTPPLIYLATKATRLLPGPETLTARIPGLAGFVLLTVFLFVFLRRRLGPWFALAAVALLPLADYTVRYAIEARSYMLLLGVSAVALVCWQATADRRSRFAPMGLAITVATALLLHVWAVLLPLALGVGEAVELLRTRRIRWRVIWSLLAASPALAIYPILLRASKTVIFGGAAYEPTVDKLYAAFRSDVPRPRVIAGVLVAACVAGWWARRRGSAARLPQKARGLAARGASPAAFDGRCITAPPQRAERVGGPGAGCVAPPSNTPGIFSRRALPAGRLARLVPRQARDALSLSKGAATPDLHHGLLPAELAAMGVLLLSPLVPYLYAELSAGTFMTRYAMFALPAMASLIGAVLFALAGGQPLAGQSAALVALVGVWLYLPPKVPVAGSQSAALESLTAAAGSLDPSVPLVLVNPVDVLAFDDQASDAERARAVFVADSALALRYTGTNGIDLGYERGEPYLDVRIRRVSYDDLTRGRARLYLLGKWQALSWLPQRLKDDGWALEEIGGTRPAPIFEGRRTIEH